MAKPKKFRKKRQIDVYEPVKQESGCADAVGCLVGLFILLMIVGWISSL